MGSVWKRLQRVNKRAAKFQFTASYHELRLETTAKWRPTNLSVVWTRRSRRVASSPLPWEPDMMSPLMGNISWPVPDNHAISVTLFKDPRTHELEDKDWTFVIEDISLLGKKRVLASASINMRKYASIESTQQSFTLSLKPVSRKITSADLELTISCVFLREGKATDEDMQSVISFMSVNNNCDIAPLDDLEDIPDLETSGDISDNLYDFTQQLEQMTTSLNGCTDVPTPLSVPSLSEDPTPLADSLNHLHFEVETDRANHLAVGLQPQPLEKIVLKDNTPGQDLLEWCKEVTKDYPNVKVTNLTTSWRNGMAFCAIIHHFMPHLIDMSKLTAHDVVGNCRTAFDAAETLGIPRVIEPRDMDLLTVPDKLAVMTYLHQLRAHFTGKQLQIEQIGPTSDESSYQEERQQKLREQARRLILETRNKIAGPVNNAFGSPTSPTKLKRFNFTPELTISPTHNGNICGKSDVDVLSNKIASTRDKTVEHAVHMSPSHRLSDGTLTPLQSFNAVVERISPKHEKRNDRLTYIESELEALEREQEAIDQKASNLEAKLRAVMGGNPSNNRNGTNPFLRLIRNSIGGGDVIRIKLLDSDDESLFGSGISGASSDTDENHNDDDEVYSDTSSTSGRKEMHHRYITIFFFSPETEETEEQLLSQWFTLVNKKNALLRRQMQLNILEQEKDLERKFTMLNQELRAAQSVEDWRKTEVQREKERLLLEELVTIVDKRDQLVQHLHNQEIAIEDDQEIARELEQVDITGGKEKCIIQ
ncbi:hypothetical protein AWZ03_013487 [Drosophila navojoa]|uniref:EH domain-binding protein 1 n=1 Tax=Drosophila navojoa TaxID=7232 RepID=A0A484AVQ7_DRONA|nr:hypothetical protein AWZ03_013487 [Drosophila navojoa]